MSTRDKLISDINEFLARNEMLPTQFGILSVGDSGLVIKLTRKGSDITTRRFDRIYKFMREYEAKQRPRPTRRAHARAA